MADSPSPQAVLETLLEKLTNVFAELHTILDASIVCETAAKALSSDGVPELATVIHRSLTHGIDEQMHAVTDCIELLGGTTCYSEDESEDDEDDEDEDGDEDGGE